MERFELPEGWEWRALGDICTPPKNWSFKTDPREKIRYIEISSIDNAGKAITEPRDVLGASAPSRAKQIVQENDVLFGTTRPYLRNVAVVSAKLNNEICSTGFCVLRPSPESVISEWLFFAAQSDLVIEQVIPGQEKSAYPAVSNSEVLAAEIPVPSPCEQRRLVARIEAQASRVEAIRKAQHELIDDMRGTLAGYYAEIIADAEWKPLGELAPQERRPVTVQAGQSYPELGVRSFGKGTFHKPAISAEQLGTKRLYHIHPGDLIFNNVFAWEGAVAVVKPEDAGRVGSHRFITCVPKPGVATTPFLYFHFTTEQGLHDLGDASPGGAGRNRTLGLKNLAAIRVPVPSHDKQVVFARLWDKVERTRRLQAELKADLAAYVPSILAKAFRGEL